MRPMLLALFCVLFMISAVSAVEVGDCVRLQSFSDLGVPLHPAAGHNGVSGRALHGSQAKITAHDAATGWWEIEQAGAKSWIIQKYIADTVDCDAEAAPESYRIGSWNLEHFKEGAIRGFPENTDGGPSIPPRTQADYEAIAAIIEALDFKILLLQEIDAVFDEGDGQWFSEELDRLLEILGFEFYDYVVGSTGGKQHLAILYDMRAARLNEVCETSFEAEIVNSKQLFDRQPLLAHFTLLDDGQPANDLLVCNVHLASGQSRTKNHDTAMERLTAELEVFRDEEFCIPADEFDLLIAGDFNANRFDDKKEDFWDDMEDDEWNVLADDPNGYPPTRLKGVPLQPGSVIDYILISAGEHGLDAREVQAQVATVHSELATDPDQFRAQASDHLPVSVLVQVGADEDPDDVIQ